DRHHAGDRGRVRADVREPELALVRGPGASASHEPLSGSGDRRDRVERALVVRRSVWPNARVSQLVEALGLFFGRVEILARGAENDRRAAEAAMARVRPLEAREHAREMLAKVPGSPVALALWADAAERAWLDPEVVTALGALAQRVPWRADVWLRLGRAALRA